MKPTFNIIWLINILRIYLEIHLLIKYYVIKHLILLRIQKMIYIKEVLLQWFINFFDKKSSSANTALHSKLVWIIFWWLKKLKLLFCVNSDLNGEEILGTIYEEELQKKPSKSNMVWSSKSDKKKHDKLDVKWKGYDNSFIVG